MSNNYIVYPDELYHYGVKGMKWGVRRYQNEDGSRTALGKIHEKVNDPEFKKKATTVGKIAGGAALTVLGGKAALNYLKSDKGKALIKKGAESAKVAFRESVKKTATSMLSGAMMFAGVKAVDKMFGSDDARTFGNFASQKKTPKDAAKYLASGGILYVSEKAINSAVGEDVSEKIMNYTKDSIKNHNKPSDTIGYLTSGGMVYVSEETIRKTLGQNAADKILKYGGI